MRAANDNRRVLARILARVLASDWFIASAGAAAMYVLASTAALF